MKSTKYNTKSRNLVLLIGLVLFVVCFFIPSTSANIGPSIHPRLYFTTSDLPAIKARMTAPVISSTWNTIHKTAISFNTFPSNFTGESDIDEITTGLRYVSLDYILTGNITQGQRAKAWLLTACGWPSWIEPLRSGYNVPVADQPIPYQVGVMVVPIAEAYDNLYPLLNASERRYVQNAILEKAVGPASNDYTTGKYAKWYGGQSNQGAQSYGGNAIAALAILEDSDNTSLPIYYANLNTIMDQYFDAYDSEGA
jgi:hypothetical protein